MISIIVSSISPEQNQKFVQNIRETIGDIPYELLVHDNRETHWGLCKLYNRLANQSNYDILCFFHEDIFFHTQDWGNLIADFLQQTPRAGVIGFAGSTLKSKILSGWGNRKETSRKNLMQHRHGRKINLDQVNPDKKDFSRVAVVDGLALIVKRDVWQQYPFDETTFRGFHLYDLDFSLQIALHYENYVCHTILVEHLSSGSYSKIWYEETRKFHQKWASVLPFYVLPYSPSFIRISEEFAAYKLAKRELNNFWNPQGLKGVLRDRLACYNSSPRWYFYNLRLIPRMLKYLLKKRFRNNSATR